MRADCAEVGRNLRLERAARNGEKHLAPLFEDLESRATAVFRSIDLLRGTLTAPVAAKAEAGPVSVPAEAVPPLTRLHAALGDFDLSAATSALADLDRTAMPGGGSVLTQLRRHVDSYEYDEARAITTRLLEQIDSKVR